MIYNIEFNGVKFEVFTKNGSILSVNSIIAECLTIEFKTLVMNTILEQHYETF